MTRFQSVAGALLLVAYLGPGWAVSAPARPASSDDVTAGELRLRDDVVGGERLPLAHTDVEAEIAGNVAQVVVTQTFHNPYDKKIEAVYVFPLPNRAAVDDMEIRVGDRVVRGVIKKRDEARRIYEDAKRKGHVAALLDQERPNIFTQSVANILPGNEIRVRIRYFEALPYVEGEYAFTFPMVVGPRFIPGEATGTSSADRGWAAGTRDVPDASRITPPVLKPGTRSGHDISLRVSLDAGADIERLDSPSHRVSVDREGPSRATVALPKEDSIPNKDFVLRYRVDGETPRVVFLPHRAEGGGDGYFLMLVQPEAKPAPDAIAPKEMIFVVDGSGSMSGFPIDKVKEAMRHALSNLNPNDTFQIVRFSNRAETFAPAPVAATEENVQRGLAYAETLSGRGGTIMLEGVRAALAPPKDPDRLRIVSFMTDGYIGNEDQILAYLEENLNGARLFPFGVGSSVNRYLLDKMAELGRGAVEYVLLKEGAVDAVQRFYERVRNPYLTELEIAWGELSVEDVYPRRLPDLFLGQPVLVHGRYSRPGRGTITLGGRLGGEPYEQSIDVRFPAKHEEGEAIATLWARARIEDLSTEQIVSRSPGLEAEITRVALEHRLVSAYTSFVAVERSIQTGADGPVLVEVPVEMPDGVSYEGVFGIEADEVAEEPLAFRGSLASRTAAGRVPDASLFERRALPAPFAPPPATEGHRDRMTLADAGVTCRLRATRTRFRTGEPIEVELTIENRTASAISVPATLAVEDGTARFQIVDTGWNVLAHPTPTTSMPRMTELAPGARIALRVVLNAPGGYPLASPGTYHVVFAGEPLGLSSSNELTLTVER